jgi:ADP-heptose:LPS heptosyltransferase
MQKFLVIQTAFIGDAVLATGLLEKLHQHFPSAHIDYLVRQGNESLFTKHPFIHEVLIWNKKQKKYQDFLRLLSVIRSKKYDKVIDVQRFATTGMLTALSEAKEKIGFEKNPFSFAFTQKIKHSVNEGIHEIERNHALIQSFTDDTPAKPRLYPAAEDFAFVQPFIQQNYICIAPTSVWYTKQFPADKWIKFIHKLPQSLQVFLLGAASDFEICEEIYSQCSHMKVYNTAGKLSFLQSAALIKGAQMNYVNDSAPMHLASAVNAPVTAIYCSTLPAFGFGPLSDESTIIQTKENLLCRPCGLHGKRECPKKHFKCATTIADEQLLETLSNK